MSHPDGAVVEVRRYDEMKCGDQGTDRSTRNKRGRTWSVKERRTGGDELGRGNVLFERADLQSGGIGGRRRGGQVDALGGCWRDRGSRNRGGNGLRIHG